MGLQILGIGTATPVHRISQQDSANWANSVSFDASHHSTVTKLYSRVGVSTRHSVLLKATTYGVPPSQEFYPQAISAEDRGPSVTARMEAYEALAGPLTITAAKRALQAGRCAPETITHLVTVSCSGFAAPGVDIAVIRELELPANVQRTHIGFMGCHGALNGLRIAKAFVESNPEACVLLCAVELCSLHHQYQGGVDQIVANALFADGAAALVGKKSGLEANHDSRCPWELIASGSTIIPETESYMSWQIRDHGFQMGLSLEVPAVIERALRPWLTSWLANHDLAIEDIGSWAIHPGGPRILQACGAALQLSADALKTSQDVLNDYGNMSSPTVLFIVERLLQQGRRAPCVMLAFGPGMTAEVALLVEKAYLAD